MKNKGFRAVSVLLTFMISIQSFCTGAVLPDITTGTSTEVSEENTVETSTEEISAESEDVYEAVTEETSETSVRRTSSRSRY